MKPVFELPGSVSALATEVFERNDSLALSVLACTETTCGFLAVPRAGFLCALPLWNHGVQLRKKSIKQSSALVSKHFISVQNESVEKGELNAQKQE